MDFATADEVRMAAAAGAPRRPGREIVARKRLVRRIWQTAERQVAEIENRLAGLRDDPQALERDAKILAIVTRTVRDIVALDQEANSLPHKNRTDEARAEPPAKSLEAFRTELALRLDQLRRERPGEGAD